MSDQAARSSSGTTGPALLKLLFSMAGLQFLSCDSSVGSDPGICRTDLSVFNPPLEEQIAYRMIYGQSYVSPIPHNQAPDTSFRYVTINEFRTDSYLTTYSDSGYVASGPDSLPVLSRVGGKREYRGYSDMLDSLSRDDTHPFALKGCLEAIDTLEWITYDDLNGRYRYLKADLEPDSTLSISLKLDKYKTSVSISARYGKHKGLLESTRFHSSFMGGGYSHRLERLE